MCNCSSNGDCKCGGWAVPVGRILLGLLFLVFGIAKLTGFDGATQMVAAGGFPAPAFFAVVTIIFEIGGGLMLISGFHARMGAWMLILLTAIATAAYHTNLSDTLQELMFFKNLSIIGGLLYVTSYGAGAWSLSHWNKKLCKGGDMCPDCKVEGDKKMM